jgi:hypothetical protein
MLDLDHKHPLGTDDDLVDLVGKPHRMAGMADVGEQHPRAGNALKLALEFLDGQRFAGIDRRPAGDVSEAWCHMLPPAISVFNLAGL